MPGEVDADTEKLVVQSVSLAVVVDVARSGEEEAEGEVDFVGKV